MKASTKLVVWTLGGFTVGVLGTWLVVLDFQLGGFVKSHWDTFFKPPRSETKILAMVAAALVLAALPFGIAEWRADARFRREERRLREERPGASVTEYDGPEGRGLQFADATGRVLLLRPAGGMAGPRVVSEQPAAGADAPLPPEA